MRKIVGWKVWYVELDEQSPLGLPLVNDDKMNVKVFASKTHKWENLPQFGLLFIKRFFQDKNITAEISFGSDSYILNHSILIDIEKEQYHKYFKCGITLPENNFNAVKKWVFEEEETITEVI